MKNLNLMLLLALAVVSCFRGVTKAELPGFYEFQIKNVKQQITVGADGTYTNALYRDGALVWSDQETWSYDEWDGEKGICFNEFRFGIPDHDFTPWFLDLGRSSRRGFWFVVPEKTPSGIRELCFDPDLDRCFQTR